MPLPGFDEFRRRSESLRRQQRLIPGQQRSFLPTLGQVAAPALSVLGAVGDIFSRPAYGVSEAYGEATEGGQDVTSTLEGLLRGVTGGAAEAKYPTLGERIVPEQEGEGLGRKVARFGADIATDPLVLFGGPVFKAAGKGAVAAGRLAKGSRIGEAVIGSDAMQGLSSLIMGTEWALPKYGKTAGKILGTKARRGTNLSEKIRVPRETSFMQKAQQLGFDNLDDMTAWERVFEVAEKGKSSGVPAIDEMADFIARQYRALGKGAARFKDYNGKGFTVLDITTGERVPFHMLPETHGHAPQMWKKEILQAASTKEGLKKEAARIAKETGMDLKEVTKHLEHATGRTARRGAKGIRRAGNLEYMRTGVIPEAMQDRNAASVFLRYLKQYADRVGYASEFGVDNKRLHMLVDTAIERGLSKKTAQMVEDAIEGRHVESPLGKAASGILGFQVLTKMGPTSTISQLSQHANTIVREGVRNYVKGLWRISTDSGLRQRSLQAVNASSRRALEEFLGKEGGGLLSDTARDWLKVTQFTRMDEGARRVAFGAGIATAEQKAAQAVTKGLGFTDELKKLGLNEAEFRFFQRTGKFTPGAESRIGVQAAKASQFAPDYLSLPPLWQSPEMKVAMQFRSFIHQQTRFLWKDVMEPAIKYMDTGGKQGSLAPLSRALLAFPIAGQGVAATRELYREASARALGVKRDTRYKRKFDYDHPLAQLARDSLYVGAFGLGGDILEQASRGKLLDWMAGPTLTDLTGGFEGAVGLAGNMAEGKYPTFEDAATFGARHLPGRRLVPLTPSELGGRAAELIR